MEIPTHPDASSGFLTILVWTSISISGRKHLDLHLLAAVPDDIGLGNARATIFVSSYAIVPALAPWLRLELSACITISAGRPPWLCIASAWLHATAAAGNTLRRNKLHAAAPLAWIPTAQISSSDEVKRVISLSSVQSAWLPGAILLCCGLWHGAVRDPTTKWAGGKCSSHSISALPIVQHSCHEGWRLERFHGYQIAPRWGVFKSPPTLRGHMKRGSPGEQKKHIFLIRI